MVNSSLCGCALRISAIARTVRWEIVLGGHEFLLDNNHHLLLGQVEDTSEARSPSSFSRLRSSVMLCLLNKYIVSLDNNHVHIGPGCLGEMDNICLFSSVSKAFLEISWEKEKVWIPSKQCLSSDTSYSSALYTLLLLQNPFLNETKKKSMIKKKTPNSKPLKPYSQVFTSDVDKKVLVLVVSKQQKCSHFGSDSESLKGYVWPFPLGITSLKWTVQVWSWRFSSEGSVPCRIIGRQHISACCLPWLTKDARLRG